MGERVSSARRRSPVHGIVTDGTLPVHRRLAEVGLRAGGPFGFALAGGHAIAAHGILQRPSEDLDLFADWQRRADFPTAVDADFTTTARIMRSGVDHRAGIPSGCEMSLAWSVTAAPVTVARIGRNSRHLRIAGASCGLGTRIDTVQCGTHRPGR